MFKGLKNYLLKGLLCTPVAEDIITIEKVGLNGYMEPMYAIKLGGQQISDIQKRNLINEVKALEQMEVWKIFQSNLTEEARKMMFENAKTTDDMFAGKMILYSMSLIKNIVESIKNSK